MIEEGARVRLRPGSRLAARHPEMAASVGIVGSIVRGSTWATLGALEAGRVRDVSMHVRFAALNIVALNVPASDLEQIDHLVPKLRVV